MISSKEKEGLLQQKAIVIWLTGLSGAGKTTLAEALEKKLFEMHFITQVLDGDIVRKGINSNLGFSKEDRVENIRRIAEISKLLLNSGIIAINSFISPTRDIRQMARDIIGSGRFIEVFVDTPIEVCEKRDIKGLYKRARAGQLPNFTGVGAPFEPPIQPELAIQTVGFTIDESVNRILDYIFPIIKIKDK
nr:adenylyl-sulfate kinase [Bacteroidota bacterium]